MTASPGGSRPATTRRRGSSSGSACGEAQLVENERVKGEWQGEVIYAMLALERAARC
jgi:hypothetical protein